MIKMGIEPEMRTTQLRVTILHITLIALVALAGVLFKFAGYQGLPMNVADCPITPTPPADLTIVPPAPEPPTPALCGFPLTISKPAAGTSVNSPVPLVATATPPDPIYTVRVYVDGLAILYSPNSTIKQLIWMPNGQHTLEVVAEDIAGYIATASIQLNVVGQDAGALNIQNQSGWLSCSAVIINSTCAAGLGTATSSLALHQSAPSLDGSAAKFSIAGPHPYSNELYWFPLGGGQSVSHFTYDLWLYIDKGDAP